MIETRRTLLAKLAIAGMVPPYGSSAYGIESNPAKNLPRQESIPLSYFALHIHDPKLPWPEYPLGRIRLWDSRTSWFHIQPARDQWDFSRLDTFVEEAGRRGIGLILPLGMSPTWAASRPSEKSPYNVFGASSEPSDLADWKVYVQTVARRYKGRILHYEIWNEVNSGAGFFTGTPVAMFELQRVAYEVLKAVDPKNIVISPSTEGSTEDKFVWFERYMGLMAGRYADVVGYHFYIPRHAPEALMPVVKRVQSILAHTGNGHLPLWNTESGYRVDWGAELSLVGSWVTWPNLKPEQAAAWLVRSFLLGWLGGLNCFVWYAFDSKIMGMVSANRSPSVVSNALGAMIERLVGCVLDSLIIEDGVARARSRIAGAVCWWVWSIEDDVKLWPVPSSMKASFWAPLDGPVSPIARGHVQIGVMPLLLASQIAHLAR